MRLLSIDSSLEYLNIGLVDGNTLLASHHALCKRRTTEHILAILDEVLKSTKTPIESIDGYVTVKGPGSYTGLRMGMGVIKTLAQVHQKPLVALNSLEWIARHAEASDETFYVLLNCARKDIFYAPFSFDEKKGLTQLQPIALCSEDDLPELIQDCPVLLKQLPSAQKKPLLLIKNLRHKNFNTTTLDGGDLVFAAIELFKKYSEEKEYPIVNPIYLKKEV